MRLGGSFSGRLKELYEAFQRSPKSWEQFKHMLGIQGDGALALLRELPGKIKHMFQEGRKLLSKMGARIRQIPAVSLYLDVLQATGSVTKVGQQVFDHLPDGIQRALKSVGSRAKTFAEFLDATVQKHPALVAASTVASAALFALIWMNVYEVSWDVPEIIRGFLGGYSWTELMQSLPESGFGFALSLLFPGIPVRLMIKAAIPATFVVRLAWLHHKGLLDYQPGKGLRVRWEDMGGTPTGAPTQIPL